MIYLTKRIIFDQCNKNTLSASLCKDLDNFIAKGEQRIPKDFTILFPFKRRLILFQNGDHRGKFTVLHFLRKKVHPIKIVTDVRRNSIH